LPGPAAVFNWFDVARSITFNSTNADNGLAGPGTIDAPTVITFNKGGPVYFNIVTNHLWSLDQMSLRDIVWASFDDSTNAPVVYPNGTSIASLESQMLIQVTSTTLPPGYENKAYSTQLIGAGASGSYTWAFEGDYPSWLTLTLDGQLSGRPTATGVHYFFVKMTDRLDSTRFSVSQVTLTVLP
jgi:hypothetical protein